MQTRALIFGCLSAVLVGIAGCGGDRSADSAQQPPVTPPTTDFSTYAASLVTTYSCESNPPAETNSIEFSFEADQDTAVAVDTDAVAAQCKVG